MQRGTDGRADTMVGWWNAFCRRWAALKTLSLPGQVGIAETLVGVVYLCGPLRVYGTELEAAPTELSLWGVG